MKPKQLSEGTEDVKNGENQQISMLLNLDYALQLGVTFLLFQIV